VQKRSSTSVEFVLNQNYPNPFNAGTKINFQLSTASPISHVKLVIYNLNGQVIKTLVDTALNPGNHDMFWDGTDEQHFAVASGVYVYVLQKDRRRKTQKMVLIR